MCDSRYTGFCAVIHAAPSVSSVITTFASTKPASAIIATSSAKDAALWSLKVQQTSLEFGMTLKDSSAYNIQFCNGKPIFIDTLSFEKYREGEPWVAYRQFCQHFLGPLALMSYKDIPGVQVGMADISRMHTRDESAQFNNHPPACIECVLGAGFAEERIGISEGHRPRNEPGYQRASRV